MLPVRQLLSHDFFIADLDQMSQTGNFDLQVLLWLQDVYVKKAVTSLRDSGIAFNDEMLKTQVNYVYSVYKKRDGGLDLNSYIPKANFYYKSDIERFAGAILDLREALSIDLSYLGEADLSAYSASLFSLLAKSGSTIINVSRLCTKDIVERDFIRPITTAMLRFITYEDGFKDSATAIFNSTQNVYAQAESFEWFVASAFKDASILDS